MASFLDEVVSAGHSIGDTAEKWGTKLGIANRNFDDDVKALSQSDVARQLQAIEGKNNQEIREMPPEKFVASLAMASKNYDKQSIEHELYSQLHNELEAQGKATAGMSAAVHGLNRDGVGTFFSHPFESRYDKKDLDGLKPEDQAQLIHDFQKAYPDAIRVAVTDDRGEIIKGEDGKQLTKEQALALGTRRVTEAVNQVYHDEENDGKKLLDPKAFHEAVMARVQKNADEREDNAREQQMEQRQQAKETGKEQAEYHALLGANIDPAKELGIKYEDLGKLNDDQQEALKKKVHDVYGSVFLPDFVKAVNENYNDPNLENGGKKQLSPEEYKTQLLARVQSDRGHHDGGTPGNPDQTVDAKKNDPQHKDDGQDKVAKNVSHTPLKYDADVEKMQLIAANKTGHSANFDAGYGHDGKLGGLTRQDDANGDHFLNAKGELDAKGREAVNKKYAELYGNRSVDEVAGLLQQKAAGGQEVASGKDGQGQEKVEFANLTVIQDVGRKLDGIMSQHRTATDAEKTVLNNEIDYIKQHFNENDAREKTGIEAIVAKLDAYRQEAQPGMASGNHSPSAKQNDDRSVGRT